MTITMQPTAELVFVQGILTRRWRGTTDRNTVVDVFVRVLRVSASEDQSAFERELIEVPAPYGEAIDLRMVL